MVQVVSPKNLLGAKQSLRKNLLKRSQSMVTTFSLMKFLAKANLVKCAKHTAKNLLKDHILVAMHAK